MQRQRTMHKILAYGISVAAAFAIVACGGGGGGSGSGSVSTGGVSFTHDQLAQEFINRAYTDAGVSLSLVKSDTNQTGYIVVNNGGALEAVYIDGWSVGQDISSYMNSQAWYDVTDIGGGYYQDADGYIYEETAATSKDLAKLTAVKQNLDINASAKNIQAQFGLSADRSQVLARLAVQLKNNPKASMTDSDYDSYAKEIMGSTITQLKSALTKQAQGDSTDVNALINKAAQTNGVGPEQVTQILNAVLPAAK